MVSASAGFKGLRVEGFQDRRLPCFCQVHFLDILTGGSELELQTSVVVTEVSSQQLECQKTQHTV